MWCVWRQVHWLRVILDEGHKVGGAALTNKLAMAANLRAERRCAEVPALPCSTLECYFQQWECTQ